jgi:Flp pilus assembly pilin Flp
MNKIKGFLLDETGFELSEYVVAAALVALVILTAFTNIGAAIAHKISEWTSNLGGN